MWWCKTDVITDVLTLKHSCEMPSKYKPPRKEYVKLAYKKTNVSLGYRIWTLQFVISPCRDNNAMGYVLNPIKSFSVAEWDRMLPPVVLN